ncbi:MAG: hypothetical protein IPP51_17220 [Bacteroidetes bacterium]|nr:hypothetical protein [Bacteroidota bacterium]
MKKGKSIFLSSLICFTLISLGARAAGFEVKEFKSCTNISAGTNDSVINIIADLSNSVLYGIQVPTENQTAGGKFSFTFKLINHESAGRFYYKIYYQNESYKFAEGSALDAENFYGSWGEATDGFHSVNAASGEIVITDSFRIQGNPRDEKKFWGAEPDSALPTEEKIQAKIAKILTDTEWLAGIAAKAKENKVSTEEQMYNDAVWVINNSNQEAKTMNNRWKRNPRAGLYRFMLVVVDSADFASIPESVKDISHTDGKGSFKNPFSYFLQENKNKNVFVALGDKYLKLKIALDLSSGIYIDPYKVNDRSVNKSYFNSTCGETQELYHRAQFAQYIHHIDKNWSLVNIKKQKDVVGEKMTRAEYLQYKTKYKNSSDTVRIFSSKTDCPCKTVKTDSVGKSISIINPGNKPGEYKKEHVGVMSRVGLTYGKWRAKIRFPKLISDDNVWNGITAAYWLAFQSDAKWNNRRDCNASVGYIPKALPDKESSLRQSQKSDTYSEIDFEILKESRYWTKTSYGTTGVYKTENAADNHDITIACTNWDLACHEPVNFFQGVRAAKIGGKQIEFCRWNDYSKLVTAKVPQPHDEVFDGDYYYFEIEWQPTAIIWRIGKDEKSMREICRMDEKTTSIPNNQMVMVMSQEFHYQEWWPTAPFLQNLIPFPKNDIIGTLMEVVIE